MPITLLDFIVFGVILLSALLAMVRGFTREVLSIASWAGAAAATIYFFPDVRDWARTQIDVEPKILADVIAGAGIFLITLIIVSLITMRLSDFILDSRIGPFDRALGFLYGAARGLLLAVVAFLFFAWLVPDEGQPDWVRNSRSKPILAGAGETLVAMLPEDLEGTMSKWMDNVPGVEGDSPDMPEDVDPNAPPGSTPPPNESGYRSDERQNMQRLLDTSQGAN